MPAGDLDEDLDYYATPGRMTSLPALDGAGLPGDVAGLTRVVQGLLIHRAWAKAYQVELSEERQREEGLHAADAMLAQIRKLCDEGLTTPRPPAQRLVGNCRHFATLLCALLRRQGTPARARCGFSAYFEAGKFVDHWVCEYWRADERRWALADAQVDSPQRAILKLEFDTLDLPNGRFLAAGEAWRMCRSGEADPSAFGIAHMWGQGYVRGNLLLDLASLNKIELLPWDVPWESSEISGKPFDALTEDELAFLDRVAALTASIDGRAMREARRLYAGETRLQVPQALLARIAEGDRGGGTGANPLASTS
ncbi:MAG: transglutaminase-like domain-containing protein [Dehalococcoidia bacterium]